MYERPSCKESNVKKSNTAILEEGRHLAKIDARTKKVHFLKFDCENHESSIVEYPEGYRGFGKTAGGEPRLQGKACRTTFSKGRANRRHKRKDLARCILRSIMSGTTLTGVTVIKDGSIDDVYRKIKYVHEQTIEHSAQREAKLPELFEEC